jgi:hypothetical protein
VSLHFKLNPIKFVGQNFPHFSFNHDRGGVVGDMKKGKNVVDDRIDDDDDVIDECDDDDLIGDEVTTSASMSSDVSSQRHDHHRRGDVVDDDLEGRGGDNGGHDSGTRKGAC